MVRKQPGVGRLQGVRHLQAGTSGGRHREKLSGSSVPINISSGTTFFLKQQKDMQKMLRLPLYVRLAVHNLLQQLPE